MSNKQYTPEPVPTWQRKDFDLSHLHNKSERERAEIETNRDLDKPIEQLVCDFHDMAEKVINPNNTTPADVNWALIHAQKRMVSLMGRVAIEHKRSSDQLVTLTWVLGLLTLGLFIATVFLCLVAHQTDDRIHQIQTQIEAQIERPATDTIKKR